MSTELPPDWAFSRVQILTEGYWDAQTAKSHKMSTAFARYIAAHEEAPVDPDVLAVREIIAAWVNQDSSYRTEAMNGKLDCREDFARCLSAYRKHRNPGASS